jgi:hypothetical protein
MLIILLCAALATMTFWPRTRTGRFLRRWLVESPARRLTPGVTIFSLMLLMVVLAALMFMKSEAFVVVGQAPEAIAWFAAFDIGTYIDVIVVAWVLAATVRLSAGARFAASALAQALRVVSARIGARSRARRQPRRVRRHTPPSDDGRGWAGLALT